MSLDFERLERVLAGAAAIQTPAERIVFLAQACGEDRDLRAEVERLLAAHEQAGDFLETPIEPASETPDSGEAAESGFSIERPGAIIGRYRLLEEIGEGAFGIVYMAEQLEPVQRKVALKIIKAGMDTREVVARFEAERQALALMDHPSIARVFDGGVTREGRPYFVMELVQGISVTEFCDQRNLPTPERLELFVQVCHAVQHAHQKGIIHRDLKPSNILVTFVDGEPVPKVIDFGVAKALGRKLTDRTLFTGFLRMVGTPAYMSPEQADFSGVDIDTRSDVYALGVVLYELLTGVIPFDEQTLRNAALDEIRRLIRETEPPKPSTRLHTLGERLTEVAKHRQIEPAALGRLVRGDLDWIVMKCLEKNRARRYETASALSQDIQRHLANEPISARPPGNLYRLQKLVQRNKLAVSAGSVAALSLIVGLAIATIMFFQERVARRQADEQAAIAKAVNDFLQNDLLRQADSRVQADAQLTANPNLTVREALERASERIGNRFKDQPLTELAIRLAIGDALRAVGRGEQALSHLARALQLSEAKLGQEHLNTFKCMDHLAAACIDVDHLEQALPLLERTLGLRKITLGPDHPDTLTTMYNLGSAYEQAGRLPEALSLLEEALTRQEAKLGLHDARTLETMAMVAETCWFAGDHNRGVTVFEEALRLRKANLGPDHPDTLSSFNNVGALYNDLGRLTKALPLLEENLKNRAAKLGPKHPDTLGSKHNLGLAYTAAGRLGEAVPLLEDTLSIRRLLLGSEHPHTLLTMNALAGAYQEAGRLEESITLLEEALKLSKGKRWPDHLITVKLMGRLACAYQESGKVETALSLHEEAVKAAKARFGPNNPQTLKVSGDAAWAYALAGQWTRALPLLEETVNLELEKLGSNHVFTLTAMNNLALAYQAVGDMDRALLLLEETLKGSQSNFGPDHRNTRRCLSDLAAAYQSARKIDRAIPLMEEVLKWRRANWGREHPQTLSAMTNLAKCLLEAGSHTRAEALARECFEIREQSEPLQRPSASTSSDSTK